MLVAPGSTIEIRVTQSLWSRRASAGTAGSVPCVTRWRESLSSGRLPPRSSAALRVMLSAERSAFVRFGFDWRLFQVAPSCPMFSAYAWTNARCAVDDAGPRQGGRSAPSSPERTVRRPRSPRGDRPSASARGPASPRTTPAGHPQTRTRRAPRRAWRGTGRVRRRGPAP
jgi:hypothetical protein